MDLQSYFDFYRKNTIGYGKCIKTIYGEKNIVYLDWTASGRLYKPIEEQLSSNIGTYVANTHTLNSTTAYVMTNLYHESHEIVRKHVNGNEDDIVITTGFGMTGAVNKLIRILNLRKYSRKPLVIISHLEHNSNYLPWLEGNCDVVILKKDEENIVDFNFLEAILKRNRNRRRLIIGSFSACSNVTGIKTPIKKLAKLIHEYGGYCFADYAASAPYVKIDMHPKEINEHLDAVFFSPHKFLGGPGSSGVLIFNKRLYKRISPDSPGGGPIVWASPWKEIQYEENIEAREDSGTPGFLQSIKSSMALKLKEKMDVENIEERERDIIKLFSHGLKKFKDVQVMDNERENKIATFSMSFPGIHYELFTKIINDKYGIQVRSGCMCAPIYGHYLFDISKDETYKIKEQINNGHIYCKPGYVRFSFHPTNTNEEVEFALKAIEEITTNINEIKKEYKYIDNKFVNVNEKEDENIYKSLLEF